MLNLMSKKRPDQQKLVGRITVDLAEIANQKKYLLPEKYDLEYCSVNAQIMFTAKVCGKKASGNAPEKFDKDSFSDYETFLAHHPHSHEIHSKTKHRKTSIFN